MDYRELVDNQVLDYDMSVSNKAIGLRLADHSFFPIFSDETPVRKRMVLTTAQDGQDRMEIAFRRSGTQDLSGGEPFAVLTLENLAARDRGDPDIDLDVALNARGYLEATATERGTGNSRSLHVDLGDALPDDPYRVPPSLSDSDLFEERELAGPKKKGRTLAPLWILLLLLLFGAAGWLFYRILLQPDRPLPAAAPAPEVAVDPAPERVEAPAAVDEPAPPPPPPPAAVEEPAPPPPAPPQEMDYHIIWGDTLWDISKRFYGTPWLFPEIAERNLIRNPDLIYAEDNLILPDLRYLER